MSSIQDKLNSLLNLLSDPENPFVDPAVLIGTAMKLPGTIIDRDEFLHKELLKLLPLGITDNAVKHNPAYAGINRRIINEIANKVIQDETKKVSSVSFLTGAAGPAGIFADIPQYFAFLLRVMQKLVYLYGFPALDLDNETIDEDTMSMLMIFTGLMFGIEKAEEGLHALVDSYTNEGASGYAAAGLTRASLYPLAKETSKYLGFILSGQIMSESVSKAIPLIGGGISGGLTWFTFRRCAARLKKPLSEISLSDPKTYRS